jgi:hypothetical protein
MLIAFYWEAAVGGPAWGYLSALDDWTFHVAVRLLVHQFKKSLVWEGKVRQWRTLRNEKISALYNICLFLGKWNQETATEWPRRLLAYTSNAFRILERKPLSKQQFLKQLLRNYHIWSLFHSSRNCASKFQNTVILLISSYPIIKFMTASFSLYRPTTHVSENYG